MSDINDEQAKILARSKDPNRYGPIDVASIRYGSVNMNPDQSAEEDRKGITKEVGDWDARGISINVAHDYSNNNIRNYARNRIIIAKAVLYGVASNGRVRDACHTANDMQDLPLWKFLLTHADLRNVSAYEFSLFKTKSVEMAKLFVEYGASMQICDGNGKTLLHQACKNEYPSTLLEYYIDHAKVDVNSRCRWFQWTPLHQLAFDICRIDLKWQLPNIQKKLAALIAANARLDLKTSSAQTPLDVLIEKRNNCVSYYTESEKRYGCVYPDKKDEIAAFDTLIAQYREAMAKTTVNNNNQFECIIM